MLLAKRLGNKVAILSRGYCSSSKTVSSMIHLEEGVLPSWQSVGDEPYMMARRMPSLPIYVGASRYQLALQAAKNASILLLDDGMQQTTLFVDLHIASIYEKTLLEKEALFPLGELRQEKKSLKDVDWVIVLVENKQNIALIEQTLSHYTQSPSIGMHVVDKGLFDLHQHPAVFQQREVAAFCAIANAERFFQTIEKKFSLVTTISKVDHEAFSEKELKQFASRACSLGAKALICTEKDAVKLPSNLKLPLPIFFLRIDLEVLFGEKEWEMLVAKILAGADNLPESSLG